MLRVYYTELTQASCAEEEQIPLSAYRQERLRKAARPAVRRQMLAAERLLNMAVSELYPGIDLPLDIRTEERGKPWLASLPLAFSLSHSGPFAACAVADHEIGLDIQVRSAVHQPLLKRCFSEDERRWILESGDPDRAFTELWSLKESYLKATGEGISRPMGGFSLDLRVPVSLKGLEDVRFWQMKEEGFCLAVCALDGKEARPDQIIKLS